MRESMSPATLAALAQAAYGRGWQSRLARDLGVNVSTVWRWSQERMPVSAMAERAIRSACQDAARMALKAPDVWSVAGG